MKKLLPLFILIFVFSTSNAQTEMKEVTISDLTELNMVEGINLHFISPEPIQFVDISTETLIGDLPSENIARIKIVNQSDSLAFAKPHLSVGDNIGVITIVGQSFMAQYKLNYGSPYQKNIVTNIQIQPEDMQPLEPYKMKFSNTELIQLSKSIYDHKIKSPVRKEKNLKLGINLNNVYVMSDYIFLDLTFTNKSNLSYNVDDIKFSIEDKKIYKATNNQSIDLKPIFKLYHPETFKKNFRNVFVFKKFTYPNSKVLKIRLVEEQFSGREIEMTVKYSDILNADTF